MYLHSSDKWRVKCSPLSSPMILPPCLPLGDTWYCGQREMLKFSHSSLLVYKKANLHLACSLQVIKPHGIDTFWTNQLEMHFYKALCSHQSGKESHFQRPRCRGALFVIFLQSLSVTCPSKWRMVMHLAPYNSRKHFSFSVYTHMADAIGSH